MSRDNGLSLVLEWQQFLQFIIKLKRGRASEGARRQNCPVESAGKEDQGSAVFTQKWGSVARCDRSLAALVLQNIEFTCT